MWDIYGNFSVLGNLKLGSGFLIAESAPENVAIALHSVNGQMSI